MKQHKFKKMALDLIELVPNDRFQVEYKYNIIWFAHFDKRYPKNVKTKYIDNDIDDERTMLIKFERFKKVLKGECLLDEI
ncbi:hypothetical protein [Staphylococcus haemolyticus]|uniref:hypothetical protein n=1 Tax=Staphylococcus haemolyticus TaxID=1283 RepID=UPI00069F3B97|nr:hypothetical protein [Staphylococcus haemolyticus]RIO94480.1 hypothetical protein BUZ39_01180 [Staphylococcus haemolyticus]TJX83669.1 hypothetical protein FAF36_09850 [Staphylococcus haemolyticus]TJX83724.1 hypothetical protein FAF36_10145 [Staphylococcus haemolyticus]